MLGAHHPAAAGTDGNGDWGVGVGVAWDETQEQETPIQLCSA